MVPFLMLIVGVKEPCLLKHLPGSSFKVIIFLCVTFLKTSLLFYHTLKFISGYVNVLSQNLLFHVFPAVFLNTSVLTLLTLQIP